MGAEFFASAVPDDNQICNIACGAFHLGVPLTLAYSAAVRDWQALRSIVQSEIKNNRSYLEVIDGTPPPVFRQPLGAPLALRFKDNCHSASQLLQKAFCSNSALRYVDHVIWICPTGGVYIHALFTCALKADVVFDAATDKQLQRQYATLRFLFLDIVDALQPILENLKLVSALPESQMLTCIKAALEESELHRRKLRDIANTSDDALHLVADLHTLVPVGDLLYDVYYVTIKPGSSDRRIGYVSSVIRTSDPDEVFALIVMYTSFACALWLMQELSEFASQAISATKYQRSDDLRRLASIRALRLFSETFIAESQPIQIRLTNTYLVVMEAMYEASRLQKIFEQVSLQLHGLAEETALLDAKLAAARDRRIGIAAATIAMLTAISAAYDLRVYLADANSQPVFNSIFLIIWLILAVLICTAILIAPVDHFTRVSFARVFKRNSRRL